VDFLFVLIGLFSLGVCYGWGATSEYWWKIGDFEGFAQFWTNFHAVGGRSPRNIFARIGDDCLITSMSMSLTVFTQRNFVADFFSSEVQFYTENNRLCF